MSGATVIAPPIDSSDNNRKCTNSVSNTLELIMTGDRLDAKRALEYGLINRMVPRAKLMDEALKLAAAICENAPISVRESLKVAKQSLDHTEAELRELSAEASRTVFATEDFKEGPRAFIEKRPPRWVGR